MGNIIAVGSSTRQLPPLEPRPPLSKPVPRLPPPRFGKLITMLSIDGGGIRGLIPAVVLARLEEKLQAIDGADARIADYFDVIAGTSTGALLAALLVTPNPGDERPLYPAKDIKQFYIDYGPSIFPQNQGWRLWQGPKYDGEFLHGAIEQLTRNKTLAETLTRVVVPTFDVKRLAPVIFSSFEDHLTNEKNIRKEIKPNLSDVCIGTSAAPTFFPAYYFEAIRPDGTQRSVFHLVDGGVGANNPTMAAITRVTRDQLLGNPEFHPDGVDYKKYLLLSVGTGRVATNEGAYTATGCAKWNRINWVHTDGHQPIIDMFSHASDFLVDLQVSMLLYNRGQLRESYTDEHDQLHSNYLRIQAMGSLFKKPVLPMDDTSDANMKSLVGIGEKLLQNKVARVDLTMGTYQTDKNHKAHTNDRELKLFAKLLADERDLRLREQEKERAIKTPTTEEGTSTSGDAFGFLDYVSG